MKSEFPINESIIHPRSQTCTQAALSKPQALCELSVERVGGSLFFIPVRWRRPWAPLGHHNIKTLLRIFIQLRWVLGTLGYCSDRRSNKYPRRWMAGGESGAGVHSLCSLTSWGKFCLCLVRVSMLTSAELGVACWVSSAVKRDE